MANQIENIYAKQAEEQLKKVLDGLTSIHKKQMELNNNAIDFYGGRTASNPNVLKQVISDYTTLIDKTNDLSKEEQKLLKNKREINATIRSEIATRKAQNAEIEKTEKAYQREQAKLQASETLYGKVQSKMNALSNEYKNLATRKELGIALTAKEEQRYSFLQTKIQTYDKTLKAVDASMGKYSRNVGNYAGSFNPLNNSINQLGREMPAFANSVQTGFMAISNNLPIFFDAMGNVIAQNKELQAQGLPTKSVLSQLAGALFSFQTLLSVGVTLLTVYGKEIVNWVSSLWGASEALDELNKNQEKFNNAKKDGRKESVAELVEVEKYVRVMRNRNLTDNERLIALEKLRSQFPAYFKDLSNEDMLNGNIHKNLADLNLALERRASLTRATEANVLNKQRLLDLQDELKGVTKLEEARRKDYEAIKSIQGVNPDVLYRSFKVYNDVQKDRIRIEKDIQSFQSAISKNDKTINELKGQTILLEETLNNTKDKGNKIKKESLDLQEREIGVETNSRIAFERNISAMQGQLDKMSILNPQYKLLEFNLRLVKDAYEALYGEQKKQESVQDPKFGTLEYYEKLKASLQQQQKTLADNNPAWEGYKRLIEAVDIDIQKLTGSTKELNETFFDAKGYFKGFVDSFANESGFSEIFKVMDLLNQNFETAEEKAKVVGLAISEAFQQAFNTISASSDANYQRMYDNLERQRDTSILFAGESTTARQEIERQYEERRRRIQRQQAESQKRLAMFNIATNTAQAIMAVFAKTPPPAGIPLALLVGAIGAAQLAMTASQPIPQFAIGTQNAPEGMAWTDERGAELHTDKNGKIKDLGSDKGARLKKLSKGDKIYTASQTKKILDLYSFNKEYDNIMLTNGIAPAPQVGTTINLDPIRNELISLKNVVANKSEVTIMNNESGTRYYERVNGQRRELVNSVLTMKSRSVR